MKYLIVGHLFMTWGINELDEFACTLLIYDISRISLNIFKFHQLNQFSELLVVYYSISIPIHMFE